VSAPGVGFWFVSPRRRRGGRAPRARGWIRSRPDARAHRMPFFFLKALAPADSAGSGLRSGPVLCPGRWAHQGEALGPAQGPHLPVAKASGGVFVPAKNEQPVACLWRVTELGESSFPGFVC